MRKSSVPALKTEPLRRRRGKYPTKDDSMESVSKNVNALVQDLRALVCHSDLTAPGSGKPTAR